MGKNVKDINVVRENIHPLTLESVFVDYKSTLNKKSLLLFKTTAYHHSKADISETGIL